MVIKGSFAQPGASREVSVSWQAGHRKRLQENGAEVRKFSDHIGKYPVVLIAPQEEDVVAGTAEIRRGFFDRLLSQLMPAYLDHLVHYQHFLKQRNAALRLFSERSQPDFGLLDQYEEALAIHGQAIRGHRAAFLAAFSPVVARHYAVLATPQSEAVAIAYTAHDTGDLQHNFLQARARDIQLGRTSVGSHRDDFLFSLSGEPIRRFGSQGQQKSFLIALKLAEFDVLHDTLGRKPLLLLDDVFDKLDDTRIGHLLTRIGTGHFGQIFLTDARPERSRQLLLREGLDGSFLLCNNGNLSPYAGPG